MNKMGIALAVLAAFVVAFLVTGPVFAQGNRPSNPVVPGTGNGGMMAARGVGNQIAPAGDSILHDAMIAVYAKELGISVDELNARLEAGETLAQIAVEKGFTLEQVRALMANARNQAIDEAVKTGTLTQEQAEWMKQRGSRMAAGNTTRGRMMSGSFAGSPNCPYYPQTTP